MEQKVNKISLREKGEQPPERLRTAEDESMIQYIVERLRVSETEKIRKLFICAVNILD